MKWGVILIGRIVALSMFVSRSMDRSFPFYQVNVMTRSND